MSVFYYNFDGKTLGDAALAKAFNDQKIAKREGWEAEMELRLDYYKGNQYRHFEELLKNQYPKSYHQMHPFLFLNIYRKMIDAMAMVYYEPPTRKLVDGTDADQELFEQVYDQAMADVQLKTAESFSAMFNTAFIQWRWSVDDDCLKMDVIEPQRFEIVQGLYEPLQLGSCQALILELQARTDTTSQEDLRRYHFWSAGAYPLGGVARSFIYDQNGTVEEWPDEFNNPSNLNPYDNPAFPGRKIYPFVKLDFDRPVIEFFDIGGDDLMAAVKNFDMRLTDLMYGAKLQAFSVPVMVHGPGQTPPSQVAFGPGLLMTIESMGDSVSDFKFVTPEPKLQEILDILVDLVELTGRLKGADPAAVRLKGDAAESGYSKQLDRGDAIKSRKNRLGYWRYYEQEIAFKAMTVYNHNVTDGPKFSPGAIEGGIAVDFADVQAELDPMQAIEIDRAREQDGIISVVDRMQDYNPDLSRAEAIEKLKENIAENREVMGRADPGKMFDDLEGLGMPDPAEPAEDQPIEDVVVDPAEAVDPTTALNGAQVSALVEIIMGVARGEMPRATGVQIISASFPLGIEDAERIMGDVGRTFKIDKPVKPDPDPDYLDDNGGSSA